MYLKLRPIFLLEPRDAFGRVSVDQDRPLPLQRGATPRRDVLGGIVQWFCAGFLRGVWPVRGEDVVGPASENEVERRAHRLGHDLTHLVVPIVHRPATVREAAAVVLFRSARRLHDPVESQEGAHDQLSHLSSPVPALSQSHRSIRPPGGAKLIASAEATTGGAMAAGGGSGPSGCPGGSRCPAASFPR